MSRLYSSGTPEIIRVFGSVRVAQLLDFYVMLCVLLFVCLSIFFLSRAVRLFWIYEFNVSDIIRLSSAYNW